jgi:DNA modification methylase
MAATVCAWQTVLKWSKAMAAHPEKRKAAAAVEQILRCVDRRQVRNWRVAADVYQVVQAANNCRFERFTPSHALELARLAPRSEWAEWAEEVEENDTTVKGLRAEIEVRKLEPKHRKPISPNRKASSEIVHGDCLKVLPTLKAGSFDVAIFSPPYPGIEREYGVWKPAEWLDWMHGVMAELRRFVRRRGSAVVIIQPNNERIGRRHTWPWEFALDMAKLWGIVQDAYWVKPVAFPTAEATQHRLMRTAVAWCLWLGEPDCFRNQKAVLWDYGEGMLKDMARRAYLTDDLIKLPHGGGKRSRRMLEDKGGATPMNCLVCAPQGYEQHPACFPEKLAQFWVRYLTPKNGRVIDPFCGAATTGVACFNEGVSFLGIEKDADYVTRARSRLKETASG